MGNVRFTIEQVIKRIEDQCIPEPNSGCVIFTGLAVGHTSYNPRMIYGMIRFGGKMMLVHRVVFQYVHGEMSPGTQVLHRCDVSLCCNSAHLFAGTNDDNHRDKAFKARGRKKLTHAKALEIHRLGKSGLSHGKIARRFSVNQSTISRILAGKRRVPASLSAAQE